MAPKVVMTATCEVRPVRRMVAISPTRSEPTAAKMRIAPRVGTRDLGDQAGEDGQDHQHPHAGPDRCPPGRPPTVTFSAVWPTEPPTATPRKKPEARLPTPCAMMSRFGFDGASPGFGAASATPAPWTRTIAAIASAPVTRLNDRSRKSGRCGSGMPRGMSPCVADPGHAVRAGQHDHHGRDHQRDQRADDGQPSPGQHHQDGQRAQPGEQRRQIDLTGMDEHVDRLGQRESRRAPERRSGRRSGRTRC